MTPPGTAPATVTSPSTPEGSNLPAGQWNLEVVLGKEVPYTHTFLLQGDGYQPATCSVDVVADQLTRVRVELQLR